MVSGLVPLHHTFSWGCCLQLFGHIRRFAGWVDPATPCSCSWAVCWEGQWPESCWSFSWCSKGFINSQWWTCPTVWWLGAWFRHFKIACVCDTVIHRFKVIADRLGPSKTASWDSTVFTCSHLSRFETVNRSKTDAFYCGVTSRPRSADFRKYQSAFSIHSFEQSSRERIGIQWISLTQRFRLARIPRCFGVQARMVWQERWHKSLVSNGPGRSKRGCWCRLGISSCPKCSFDTRSKVLLDLRRDSERRCRCSTVGHNASPAYYGDARCSVAQCLISKIARFKVSLADLEAQSRLWRSLVSEQTKQTLCRVPHIDPGRLWRKSSHLGVSVCFKGLSKCSYKCSYIILYHFVSIQDKAVQTSYHFSQLDVSWSNGFLGFKSVFLNCRMVLGS